MNKFLDYNFILLNSQQTMRKLFYSHQRVRVEKKVELGFAFRYESFVYFIYFYLYE